MSVILETVIATLFTLGRVWITIALSIITGWFLGYLAIKSHVVENIYVSLIEIFESVPVFSFLPIVLIFFVFTIGGNLGIQLAVLFLVFTAVVWNIWMGIYQAYKTIPQDMLEVSENYRFSLMDKFSKLYIPYSMPRIASNLFPSFVNALFYITVSEVFSIGNSQYQVFGIGSLINYFVNNGLYNDALIGIVILIIWVIIFTLVLRELAEYIISRFGLDTEIKVRKRGRLSIRYSSRISSGLSTIVKLGKAFTIPVARRSVRQVRVEEEKERSRAANLWKYVGISISVLILSFILYGSISVIISVPLATWSYLVSNTPFALLSIAVDYIRVAVVTLISLLITIFLGYFIVVHKRIERVILPLIQIVAAIPAPVYFPFLYAFSISFISHLFGAFTNEFYVLLLGFLSTFYYSFFSYYIGVTSMPVQFWEIMKNYELSFWQKLRQIILPSTMPYLITGITSTVNSTWGGLAIAEYWPNITQDHNLYVRTGLMKDIVLFTNQGEIALASWFSLIFAIVVVVYSILFTRKLMDLARKKYIAEEGVYLA
ncbi:ABC transporter permease subunit [Sulfolobus acidocaldarius]|uniref:ABC transporter n=4 Tax=Sulfolobus acidocaldarius TaxID=2285 RepID=Q4JC04_SULAC|nr:ABC transporter permease subunit [Sulfolobus acidocaldarius]AAY79675.1 ABC transporter [Sulfolobus acidocaldarius DSM 639]AGE70233.1 ABC transporter [Sulfolobus acidocaldarius N8]AGE72508.1 ABC transporter [Sulfolobus acidocaldarius Ron12/I]ALU29361.1 sugar ABC transporter permease [Sulfolobus acidocaldarius]ALU32090.1 sugar ABC transporter permease [Sulfolobus acidocaldarius]